MNEVSTMQHRTTRWAEWKWRWHSRDCQWGGRRPCPFSYAAGPGHW